MEVHLLGVAGSVHEGLMGAATFVHCNTAQALERAGREHPGLPLLITGHSMGGAPLELHQAVYSMQGGCCSLAPLAQASEAASHKAASDDHDAYHCWHSYWLQAVLLSRTAATCRCLLVCLAVQDFSALPVQGPWQVCWQHSCRTRGHLLALALCLASP